MVTPNSVTAEEFSTPSSSSNDDTFSSNWIGRFNVDGLSLSFGTGVLIEDTASGVSSLELTLLAAKDVLELKASLGTNRRSLAQALQRTNASEGSILIELDGDRHDADTTVARLVSILSELSTWKEASSAQQRSIRNSSIFIDNVQFLCKMSKAALQGLIDLRRDGGVVPRLVVGTLAGCQAGLLHLVSLEIAPLSERPDDVVAFVERRFRSRRNTPVLGEDAYAKLRSHTWLGEEAELLNFVIRAQLNYADSAVSADAVVALLRHTNNTSGLTQPLADVEEAHIYRVLEHNGWNRTRSAKTLGIDVKTLYNKLRRYESKKRVTTNNS
ncbi:MAG: hypothetical protein ACI97A_000756 [Planctomycetota bacterium]|jgi:hypothetical protein